MEKSAGHVTAALADTNLHYGIKTNMGKLANIRVSAEESGAVQHNVVLSHCCGVGKPLPDGIVRLMMTLKIMWLCRGASGVRGRLVQLLIRMLKHDVLPIVPEKGSVGASGDLAPLLHMAVAMMGHGSVSVQGNIMPARNGLKLTGYEPISLRAKEGVALINSTQMSTALALVGLFAAYRGLAVLVNYRRTLHRRSDGFNCTLS